MKNPHKQGTVEYNQWIFDNPDIIDKIKRFLIGYLRNYRSLNNVANWLVHFHDRRVLVRDVEEIKKALTRRIIGYE